MFFVSKFHERRCVVLSQGTGLVGGSQSGRIGLYSKTVVPVGSRTQSDLGGGGSDTRSIVAGLPKWHSSYACHHVNRLGEPAARGGAWDGLL